MNEFARPCLAEEKLPPVSTADNDKVLTVDGGVWKAKTPSGGTGGGVLVVNADADGILDKTWQEIYDAYTTGGAVIAFHNGSDRVDLRSIENVLYPNMSGSYVVISLGDDYITPTASGYPQLDTV